MQLNNKQIKWLKGQAHSLKPLLMVGKESLSDSLLKEADAILEHHQLIKVRVLAQDRDDFKEIAAELATETKSSLISTIGRIIVLYRAPLKSSTVVKVKVA